VAFFTCVHWSLLGAVVLGDIVGAFVDAGRVLGGLPRHRLVLNALLIIICGE
jgi:hypothetical protein